MLMEALVGESRPEVFQVALDRAGSEAGALAVYEDAADLLGQLDASPLSRLLARS
ncbi:MAG: hypothetical protein KY438_05410 [Actinobacteria bacterium]|nr:hypothetical protein [Actinomycetota bacterium]